MDSLTRPMAQLGIEDAKGRQPKDHYVHIDFTKGSSPAAAKHINEYMNRNGAFCPKDKDNLDNKREKGKYYYELWKVPKTFSPPSFGRMVAGLPRNKHGIRPKVRIVSMNGSDHTVNEYEARSTAVSKANTAT